MLFCGISALVACSHVDEEHPWPAYVRDEPDAVRALLRGGEDSNYVSGGLSILMQVARDGDPEIADIVINAEPN
jgi:hypothetical protein